MPAVRGACGHDCPDTCSWLVEIEGTRATRLSGDPEHPFTRGTLCAKVNHYLERVYHPDRVLSPLRRVGAKGEARFERVSWDAALTDIAERWQRIIATEGAEAILPYSLAGTQGAVQMASLDRRLFGLLGASQLERAICGEVASIGIAATQGSSIGIDPEDLVHSRYIVLWGTNTIVTNLHLWPVILEARRRGAKIVTVDPIRTRTAAASDLHVPLRPASDAALALAMMHVIVRDGLADLDYLARFTEGFASLRERVLRDYAPEQVAEVTGLEPGFIESFAREYATTRPAVLRPLIAIEHHRNGAMLFRTLACLPLLTGAWRERGGGLIRSTGALQYATLNAEGLTMPSTYAPARTLNMRDLGEMLCSGALRPRIASLFVHSCNPVVTVPNQNRIVEGLRRPDLFTVVHELFVTETARYADYVLPATSQIEHLDLVPAWGHHYLSLNQPALPPQGESVSNTELARRFARALGRREPWLYDSDETLVRTALASGHPWLEGITFEHLRQHGYARLRLPDGWQPFREGFPTKSGKALLYSEELAAMGLDPLPAAGEIRRQPGQLQLITGKTLHFLNGSYAESERQRRREGELFIEIHAADAEQSGVADGEMVRVFNGGGELMAHCRVTDRVGRGVAWMPFGGFRDAVGERRSANALTPEEPTDWGGGSGFYDAFVRVAPASSEARL